MNRRAPEAALGQRQRPRPEDRRRADEAGSRWPGDESLWVGARSEGFAEDLPDDAAPPASRFAPTPGAWLWLLPLVAVLGAGAQAWRWA